MSAAHPTLILLPFHTASCCIFETTNMNMMNSQVVFCNSWSLCMRVTHMHIFTEVHYGHPALFACRRWWDLLVHWASEPLHVSDWTQTVANTDWMGKQQQRVKSRTFVSACFCISVVQWRSTSSEWVMTHMILTLITSVYVISSPSIPIGPPLVLGMGCSLVCQK